MAFSITRVTPETAGLLDRVADDVFDDAIDPVLLAAYLADPNCLMFVASSEGRVVGQGRGMWHRNPDRAPDFYIDNLGVAPSHRRRGIATALMNALVTAGTAGNVTDVWLATEADNNAAVAFYRAYGLIETRVLMYSNFEEG